MIKVFEADNTSQLFFVDNPPAATMWHPTNDVLVLWIGYNGMELHGESSSLSSLRNRELIRRIVRVCMVNYNRLASIAFPLLLFALGRIRGGALLIETTEATCVRKLALPTLNII
jgi:hypothetical protein